MIFPSISYVLKKYLHVLYEHRNIRVSCTYALKHCLRNLILEIKLLSNITKHITCRSSSLSFSITISCWISWAWFWKALLWHHYLSMGGLNFAQNIYIFDEAFMNIKSSMTSPEILTCPKEGNSLFYLFFSYKSCLQFSNITKGEQRRTTSLLCP